MVELPEGICARIKTLCANKDLKTLAKAYSLLQQRYCAAKPFRLESLEEHLVYLMLRLPGTYAACWKVLDRLIEMDPAFKPHTLLDLGAGPATAALAALDHFPLKSIDLIEQNRLFIDLGTSLLENRPHSYRQACFSTLPITQGYDLITASYSLSETDEKTAALLIEKALENCRYLVITEPGTPYGYSRILQYRAVAAKLGSYCIAPCPHDNTCPMEGSKTWCHFSERLPRNQLQKHIKNADLGYEDEKYCYLILGKTKIPHNKDRIVHMPKKHSGHIQLTLCTTEGVLETKTLSKSQGSIYKQATKSEWGDLLPKAATIRETESCK